MTERTKTLRDRDAPRSPEAADGATAGLLVLFSEGQLSGDGVYAEQRTMTIGRQPDQGVFVDDEGMSRQHAVLTRTGGALRLRDAGSHNGTFVNGAAIHDETGVSPGDVIRCGATLLLPISDARRFRGWTQRGVVGPLLGGPAMEEVRRRVALLATQDLEVLILGESGTGKDVAARLLHESSGRSGPLVAVNCAAMPESLFEAELFGARKGAFTGASADRPGLMHSARGGSLFLDEIGDLPLPLQPKLLRAVEQREVRPLGGGPAVRLDTRIIAATHRDLKQRVAEGSFREDLYFRICGATIELPPLRARREDIWLIGQALLARAVRADGAPPLPVTAQFVEQLLLHRWPGNVRELERAIRQARLEARLEGAARLEARHLRLASVGAEEGEREQLRRALSDSGGNVKRAAAALGVPRGQIYRLLERHGLRPKDFRG